MTRSPPIARPQGGHLLLQVGPHLPAALKAADPEEEVAEEALPWGLSEPSRVDGQPKEGPLPVAERDGSVPGGGDHLQPRGRHNPLASGHHGNGPRFVGLQAVEEVGPMEDPHRLRPVQSAGRLQPAAQLPEHGQKPGPDGQKRKTRAQELGVETDRVGVGFQPGLAGQDQPLGLKGQELRRRCAGRHHLGVDLGLPDPAGDEGGRPPPHVQNQDPLRPGRGRLPTGRTHQD